MARGSDAAQSGARTGLGFASQTSPTLIPELQQEATAPPGMSPVDLARENTAAQQSAGGSQSAATGQGGLIAARTKNPGSTPAAVAQSARTAGEDLSRNALGIQTANAKLKEEQRQSGLKGLQGMALGGLEQVAPNVNADVNQQNASWDWAKDILGPVLSAAGGSASGYLSRA